MTLTSLGHVTSSVEWLFESQWVISYWWSTETKSVSPAVFEILGAKHIWVMTLTFLGHLTSSVTLPFESQWVISYWWSTGTRSVSTAVFEVLSYKHIRVTTLTFQGYVTSSVTWLFESQYAISYWCSIGSKSLSLTDSEILCPKPHVPIGTMLNSQKKFVNYCLSTTNDSAGDSRQLWIYLRHLFSIPKSTDTAEPKITTLSRVQPELCQSKEFLIFIHRRHWIIFNFSNKSVKF